MFVEFTTLLLNLGLDVVDAHSQVLFKQVSALNLLSNLCLDLSQVSLFILKHHLELIGLLLVMTLFLLVE